MSVRLNIGDVVLAYISDFGGKQGIGLIKYIGSIRGGGCDIMREYVGIELIEPIECGHNGDIGGYQYFQCKKQHGIHCVITNVLKILPSSEIFDQLQQIVAMFKTKLSQYIGNLNQKDSYIRDLQLTQKRLKTLLSAAQHSNHSSPHFGPTQQPKALAPIVDSNNIRDMAGNQSLDAMINKVDHITSQSLAIQLNASRVRVNRATLNSMGSIQQTPTPNTTTTATHSPRTVTNTLESGTPSSNTPAPQSHRNNRTQTHLSQQLNFTSDQISDGAATMSPHSPHTPHTPNTPCNQSFNMLYPEYIDDEHDNDTSSFFTDGSSAYNTPKSLTTKSNAHGLLSQYNSRKSSKPINSNNHSSRSRHRSNSKSKNDTHPRLKSRDKSKANKSHSHRSKSRRRSDNKNNNNNNMNK